MDLYCCWLQNKKVTVLGIRVFKAYRKHSAPCSCHLHLFPVLSFAIFTVAVCLSLQALRLRFLVTHFFSIEHLSHTVKYEYLKPMIHLPWMWIYINKIYIIYLWIKYKLVSAIPSVTIQPRSRFGFLRATQPNCYRRTSNLQIFKPVTYFSFIILIFHHSLTAPSTAEFIQDASHAQCPFAPVTYLQVSSPLLLFQCWNFNQDSIPDHSSFNIPYLFNLMYLYILKCVIFA